jgi:hypothetical protein
MKVYTVGFQVSNNRGYHTIDHVEVFSSREKAKEFIKNYSQYLNNCVCCSIYENEIDIIDKNLEELRKGKHFYHVAMSKNGDLRHVEEFTYDFKYSVDIPFVANDHIENCVIAENKEVASKIVDKKRQLIIENGWFNPNYEAIDDKGRLLDFKDCYIID